MTALTHAHFPGARTERFAGIIPAVQARHASERLRLWIDVTIGQAFAHRDRADGLLAALACAVVEFPEGCRGAGLMALARLALAAEQERPN